MPWRLCRGIEQCAPTELMDFRFFDAVVLPMLLLFPAFTIVVCTVPISIDASLLLLNEWYIFIAYRGVSLLTEYTAKFSPEPWYVSIYASLSIRRLIRQPGDCAAPIETWDGSCRAARCGRNTHGIILVETWPTNQQRQFVLLRRTAQSGAFGIITLTVM